MIVKRIYEHFLNKFQTFAHSTANIYSDKHPRRLTPACLLPLMPAPAKSRAKPATRKGLEQASRPLQPSNTQL